MIGYEFCVVICDLPLDYLYHKLNWIEHVEKWCILLIVKTVWTILSPDMLNRKVIVGNMFK